MKAILKQTGEEVEVIPNGTMSIHCAAYKTKDGRIIPSTALEFEKRIDWEQRRYEIAKTALQAIMTGSVWSYKGANGAVEKAIEYADALIVELKKRW